MNHQQIGEILVMITAAYPKEKITEATASVYAKMLSDIPFQAAEAAVQNHIAKSKWFPTIAELRQEAISLLPGNDLPTADEAWDEVCQEIRRIGSYGIPEFTRTEIKKAVQGLGGWMQLCASEDSMVDRAHFIKMYGTIRERAFNETIKTPESKRLEQILQNNPLLTDGRE